MKVKVIIDNSVLSDYVTITCKELTDEVIELEKLVENYGKTITGKLNNETYLLNIQDIYYFEAVDNKVFAYTVKEVYEVNYKIVELVEYFKEFDFIQVSRTVVLNINYIDRVQSMINGKILAILSNKEKMIITRAYANDFKLKIRKEKNYGKK